MNESTSDAILSYLSDYVVMLLAEQQFLFKVDHLWGGINIIPIIQIHLILFFIMSSYQF